MSSGQRRVKFNTLEMALSPDFNLLQDLLAAHGNQALRRMHQRASTGFRASSYPIQQAIVALPTATHGTVHDCFGGLMVNCDNSSYLLVSEGSAGFLAPGFGDQGSFDSSYVIVNSFGVSSSASLPFVANASGSPRIDVVECKPLAVDEASETRAVFNSTTKVFVPTSVVKRKGTELQFRIRQGTPGSGFPAVEQDWMPLAVARVPSGASGFLQCDFWDVRPLTSWRAPEFFGQGATTDGSWAELGALLLGRQIGQSSTVDKAFGHWTAYFRGYVAGGSLRTPTNSGLCDLADTALHASGAAAPSVTAGALSALVAVYPMGLPRWARYSSSAIASTNYPGQNPVLGRIPVGSTGILVLAKATNIRQSGECDVSQMPSIFGGSPGSFPGFVVCWALRNYDSKFQVIHANYKRHSVPYETAAVPTPFQDDDTWTASSLPATSVILSKYLQTTNTAPAWLDSTNHLLPYTAKSARIWARVSLAFGAGGVASSVPELTRLVPGGGHIKLSMQRDDASNALVANGTDMTYERIYDVEMDLQGLTDLELSSAAASSTITAASTTSRILGWEDF